MRKTYCGACRGERGCPDCQKAARSADYTGITEFLTGNKMPDLSMEDRTECVEGKHSRSCRELLLAADLGTTTLAFVCTQERGQMLASYGTENPQRKTAADVIGRIDAAIRGQRERLTKEIREALAQGFLFVFEKGNERLWEMGRTSVPDAVHFAIAGNTTMQHLLLDYPVDGMAKAPFIPYTVAGKVLSFAELFSETERFAEFPEFVRRADVTIFPCFSAFVGGDLAAGAYALAEEVTKKHPCILIDLGTNGELLLFDKDKIYGTAAAMGSAFEGG
ncbi:MAG: ASKHA domain-containing protein, partial [Lachnospiraceae bacterium]|nr:ASKHA domain-containing protein [Lachnospiraceae bacterium]